jgi:drug/metabolite transporter (DMT)-like permease
MSRRHLALVVLGVVAVSFSGVLVRLADAPALAVAFYRTSLAAGVLLPLALSSKREEFRALNRPRLGLAVASGALLAAHFATWIPSLDLTTVSASTVLVTTQPIWVAVLGKALGERLTRSAKLGVAIALVGAVIVSGGDFAVSGRALLGDALAIAGAICGAGYVMAGRRMRQSVSVLTYVAIVYTTCAVILALVLAASGTPFLGYEPRVWLMFVLITIGPQIMGHTVFNYLLAFLEASIVVIAIMAEPVGATILAFFLLEEVPPLTAVVGGVVILVGVFIAITAQTRAPEEVPVE